MKTLLNNLLNRNHENEADEHLNKGRAVMIRIKKRGTHREKPEKHYSLPLWKKCATYLMLFLTLQLIVPPQVIAQEIAEAQQRAIIEQNQRNFRTKAPEHLEIAQQTEATIQLLLRTCRQIENNAYSQQNYLANVANANTQLANQLQQNELSALSGATELNYANRGYGSQAATNLDAANNAWLGSIGKGLQAVGGVASVLPGVGGAVGNVMQGVGGALSGMAAPTTDYTTDQRKNWQTQFSAARANDQLQNYLGANKNNSDNLSIYGNNLYNGSVTNTLQNYMGNPYQNINWKIGG